MNIAATGLHWRIVLITGILCAMTATKAMADHLIDLTHTFSEETIYWPTEEGFKLIRESRGVTDEGYFYAANRFMCAEHGGTHIDAPIHFWQTGETVDQIPLQRLIGPGACVDVSKKCTIDPNYQVTVEDFQAWEEATGESLEDRIVLIYTGFARHWPDRKKYLGTDKTGREGVANLHFPGLDPAAADWLVARRRIRLVGIDTASIDHGQTREYPTHVRLFRSNTPALENVAIPSDLAPVGFTVAALPMKIGDGSGAPCRVVAIFPKP